jgi:acyl carrier protein
MEPVPVNVPGEVYIGGDALARGYLGRPGMTAERFVPDPVSGEPGARLYRTGDRARRRADGVLEFLGRVDDQVKIRGFRVEPGEVEAALRAHPAVSQAAVVAREDAPGDRRLAAYVAPRSGGSVDAPELRAYLAARLPEHLVPSSVTVLDRLPLNPSGKVDRRALPAPDAAVPAAGFVEPAGGSQAAVAEIWSEVLGAERVGAHDNFFDLGGHSLRATRILARIREALGVSLPVSALFDHPTPAGLARLVDERRPAPPDDAGLLAWIESLSDEEAERLLAHAEGG